MTSRIRRFRGVFFAAVLLVAAAAACDSSAPVTTGDASLAPSSGSSAAPATPKPTKKPSPTLRGSGTATATPAGSPVGSPPAPTASSRASMCTGSLDIQSFWADAAKKLPFAVYCAVLPKGWSVRGGSWEGKNGGRLTFGYKGPAGATLELNEGSICSGGGSTCEPTGTELGTASFASMPGTLFSLGPGAGYAIYINPGSSPAWSITGTGLAQDTFTFLAGALRKVPKG